MCLSGRVECRMKVEIVIVARETARAEASICGCCGTRHFDGDPRIDDALVADVSRHHPPSRHIHGETRPRLASGPRWRCSSASRSVPRPITMRRDSWPLNVPDAARQAGTGRRFSSRASGRSIASSGWRVSLFALLPVAGALAFGAICPRASTRPGCRGWPAPWSSSGSCPGSFRRLRRTPCSIDACDGLSRGPRRAPEAPHAW